MAGRIDKFFVLLGATALLASCATTSPRERRDQEMVDSIRQAANRARANPKNAKATKAYAREVGQAWNDGVFNRCATNNPPDKAQSSDDNYQVEESEEPHCRANPKKWTQEALKLLKKSAQVHKADAPILYAECGLLLVRAGEIQAAVDELHRSMELRPNFDAGVLLISYYSGQSEYDRVKKICRQTTPHIQNSGKKFKFIDHCVEESGAASERGALSWASTKQKQFYQQEQQRRRRARERRQRRRQQAQREQKKCKITCKERGHLCLRDCHTDECETECNNAYRACLQKCEL